MNTVAALRPFRRFLPAGATLVVALSAPTVSHAVIIADFTGGNGTDLPDQWTGAAGAGWASAWVQSTTAAAGTGVVNTSPIHGGDNYLQFIDNGTTGAGYIRRVMDNSGGVDLSEPYRLTLSFRYDGTGLADFTEFNDRIAIFADPGAPTGTGASNSWIIGVSGSIHSKKWYFYDRGSSNTFEAANMYNTGLDLVPGRVYAITVDVDPAAGKYGASIDDGINPAVSATDLDFRRGADGTLANTISVNLNKSAATDSASFSVDNIQIQQVPEPSSAVALLLGASMLAMRRRRLDCPAFEKRK